MLIEKSEPLKYIKESGINSEGKHYLGKLAGVASDWTKPTRNGRRYPYELWVNVQNSDDFKEGMETLTIFGEADHPETRVETSIKEIAIVMTKYEIRKDEGYVYAEFDILDTPNGRILKELCDYGSKIGVSSRGLGDEVVVNGETIIDPETYMFYGYDAVIMPAVATARPAVIESTTTKSDKSLLETFNREIDNATSVAELKSIEKLAESVNIPNLDSVKESIKNKIGSYNNEGEDISTLRSDLDELLRENKELKDKVSVLESKITAKDIRIKNFRTRLSSLSESTSNLRKLLMNASKESKEKDNAILEGVDQIDELTDTLESVRISYERKIKNLQESNKRFVKQSESKINSLTRQIESSNRRFNHKISDMTKKHNEELSSLRSDNQQLKESVSDLSKQLESANSSRLLSEKSNSRVENTLRQRLKESQQSSKTATEKYLEVKCAESGIDVQTAKYNLPKNYSIEDIDKTVSKLADRKLRMSKVPFYIQPNTMAVNEMRSNRPSASDEEQQTMQFLEESFNKH